MEVYTLDQNFRRTMAVDLYESLVWTERYRELGDFKLKTINGFWMLPDATVLYYKDVLSPDTMLAITGSYRVMVIETVIESEADTGEKVLEISGRSLEKILAQRVAQGAFNPIITPVPGTDYSMPMWHLEGTAGEICRYMFEQICVEGLLNSGDVIPFITSGTIFPPDTIEEPTEEITIDVPPMSLLDAIKQVCDVYDLGFRLIRNPYTNLLYFDIYTGRDRTTNQTIDPAVIFSPETDSLANTSELTSVETEAVAAYVFSPLGSKIVYSGSASDLTDGFERKVLYVDGSSLTESADVEGDLDKLGFAALATAVSFQAFDGEINQNSQYKYNASYNLGDQVEQRNDQGFANYLRVTEQIISCDVEGERSYPTLSKNLTVTPGSWAAMGMDEWDDLDDEEWADMP